LSGHRETQTTQPIDCCTFECKSVPRTALLSNNAYCRSKSVICSINVVTTTTTITMMLYLVSFTNESKVIWQKAASPTSHSRRLQMDSSGLDPAHLIHTSLGPPESARKRHLDRFSHFFQGSRTLLTDRHKHRQSTTLFRLHQ